MTRKVSPDGRGTVESSHRRRRLPACDAAPGGWVLEAAAIATLALVVLASLLRPVVPWDSWAYHLPFSAWLWDIGDAGALSSSASNCPPDMRIPLVRRSFSRVRSGRRRAAWRHRTGQLRLVVRSGRGGRNRHSRQPSHHGFGSLSIPLVPSTRPPITSTLCRVMICLQVLRHGSLSVGPARRTLLRCAGPWWLVRHIHPGSGRRRKLQIPGSGGEHGHFQLLALYLISNRAQLVRVCCPAWLSYWLLRPCCRLPPPPEIPWRSATPSIRYVSACRRSG